MSSLPEPSDSWLETERHSAQALVLERHAATRIGFGLLLRSQPWIDRCLLSADREEAVTIAHQARPDVAIVDITDVGPFVNAYIAPLRDAHAGMSLLLSTRNRDAAALSVPASVGAAGLFTSDQSIEEMVRAIRYALIEAPPSPTDPVRADGLSKREYEVLMLLSTGATNREIAQTLHVSAETVKKHAAALYRKLGVRNRTEAAQAHTAELSGFRARTRRSAAQRPPSTARRHP